MNKNSSKELEENLRNELTSVINFMIEEGYDSYKSPQYFASSDILNNTISLINKFPDTTNEDIENLKSSVIKILKEEISFSSNTNIEIFKSILQSSKLDKMFSKTEIKSFIEDFKDDSNQILETLISVFDEDTYSSDISSYEEYVKLTFSAIADYKKKEIFEHLRLLKEISPNLDINIKNEILKEKDDKKRFFKIFDILNELTYPPIFKIEDNKIIYLNNDFNKSDVSLFYFKNDKFKVASSSVTKDSGNPEFEGVQNITHPFVMDLIAKKLSRDGNIPKIFGEDVKNKFLLNDKEKIILEKNLRKRIISIMKNPKNNNYIKRSFYEKDFNINKDKLDELYYIGKDYLDSIDIDRYLNLLRNHIPLILTFQSKRLSFEDIDYLIYNYTFNELNDDLYNILKKENIAKNPKYEEEYLSNCDHNFTIIGNKLLLKDIDPKISLSIFVLGHYDNLYNYNIDNSIYLSETEIQDIIDLNISKIKSNNISIKKINNITYMNNFVTVKDAKRNIPEIVRLLNDNKDNLSNIFSSKEKRSIIKAATHYLYRESKEFQEAFTDDLIEKNEPYFLNVHVLKKSFSRSQKNLKDVNEKLNKTNEKLKKSNKKLNETSEKLNETSEKLNETSEKLNETSEKLNETNEKIKKNKDLLNNLKKMQLEDLKKEIIFLKFQLDVAIENYEYETINKLSLEFIKLLKENNLKYEDIYIELAKKCKTKEFQELNPNI